MYEQLVKIADEQLDSAVMQKIHRESATKKVSDIAKENLGATLLGTAGISGLGYNLLHDFVARKSGASAKSRILHGIVGTIPAVGLLALARKKLYPNGEEKAKQDYVEGY